MVQTQMSQFVNNYSQYLGTQPKGSQGGGREVDELDSLEKQIEALNVQKKAIQVRLDEVKGPIKEATVEKIKAQQEMTEK